jgi:E3 SUMO-protein ligase PIAS1
MQHGTQAKMVLRYVKDILAKTPKSVDSVTIEPGGRWHLANSTAKQDAPARDVKTSPFDEDDEALVISDGLSFLSDRRLDTPLQSVRGGASPHVTSPHGTSREVSTNPRTSSKRPFAEVIDLTLSDDDDDGPPVRAPPEKRQNTGAVNQYYIPNGTTWPA